MDASILNYKVNDNVGDFLSKEKKLYIAGKWVDPNSGKSFDVEDPATGKKIASCSAGNSKTLTLLLRQQEKLLILEFGLICLIVKKVKSSGKLVI